MYAQSPAAYNALRSFKLLQLPSESTLSHYKSSFREQPGEIESRLQEEQKMYAERKREMAAQGKLLPLGEGILIFDEVKVVAKLQWNSRDNSLVGYAMTTEDMTSIADLYESIDQDSSLKTDYIL